MSIAVVISPYGIPVAEEADGTAVEVSLTGTGMLVRYVPSANDATAVATVGGFPGYTVLPNGQPGGGGSVPSGFELVTSGGETVTSGGEPVYVRIS